MQEIKFRAWQKDYGGYMFYSHKSKGLSYLEFNHDSSTVIGEDDGDQRYEASKMPLMQYTGLKDKKGIEIYIGDIIIDNNMFIETVDVGIGQMPVAELPDGRIWEVTMRDFEEGIVLINNQRETGCCDHVEGEFSITECEIIGNIYQNPELLK